MRWRKFVSANVQSSSNAINLTDVRQTHFAPSVRPVAGPGGNSVADACAPLDGQVFNLGIRAEL